MLKKLLRKLILTYYNFRLFADYYEATAIFVKVVARFYSAATSNLESPL